MFYLESSKGLGNGPEKISDDVATVAELLDEKAYANSVKSESLYKILDINNIKDIKKTTQDVPVGSIDFCETFLGKHIHPLNIPEGIRDPMYIGRQVACIKSSDLLKTFRDWSTKELFIKSATRAKTGYIGIYSPNDVLPEDDLFFVSTVIDVTTEWRCFVWNGKVVDIRRYRGSYKDLLTHQDLRQIDNTVTALNAQLGPAHPAYTVDFGRAENMSAPVVIEVQDFIACGLYGFADKVILPMLAAAAHAVK